MGCHRGVFVRYSLVLFHPQYHPDTNKGLLCLVGRMDRGNRQGRNFYCFQERGKCCTIFDFENCAALISLETLLISAEHPLESVCLSVWHPLENKKLDIIFIILKSEFTWTSFDYGVFINDSHIVSTWYP